ncbi:MAG: glycosyltransferase, partial [Nitrosopumilus sp.]
MSVLAWVGIAYKYFQVIRKTPKLGTSVETGVQPKVSIIMPARNEEKYLAAALTSLSNQRYMDYE